MNLIINTDYAGVSTGSPEPCLRRIASAGFSHVHWCHEWKTDYLYTPEDIDRVRAWLTHHELRVTDLHASNAKSWDSPVEAERLAGVGLVSNRIDLVAALGGDVIVMHTGMPAEGLEATVWRQLRRSLDAIEPHARRNGVRIAIENVYGNGSFIDQLFDHYPPEYIGLCYDSGHGNFGWGDLDALERCKRRLIAMHVNDNNGTGDQHNIPFTGTVDWERLARITAESSYNKAINLELSMRHSGIGDETLFLERALAAGTRLAMMVETRKGV